MKCDEAGDGAGGEETKCNLSYLLILLQLFTFTWNKWIKTIASVVSTIAIECTQQQYCK